MTDVPAGFSSLCMAGRLIYLRGAAGFKTQAEAAKALGVSRPYLCRLESGQKENITLRILLAICRVYGVHIGTLTEGLK